MANQLVMKSFRAAVGSAGVRVFRPGDVVVDTDPDFAAIVAAAPAVGGLAAYPLAPALSTAAAAALSDRSKAVPDDIVEVNLLSAAI